MRITEFMRVRRKLWIVKIVDTKNEVGCIINVLQEHISLDTVADVFNGKRNFGGNDCSHYKSGTLCFVCDQKNIKERVK